MNIFQKAITPDMPRVLEGEQIYVYVPQATSTNAGIASYKNSDFKVNDGVVSLRRERRDAYNIPDLVLLDERHFPREIVEKDGNEYYKYTTNAILHIVQNLSNQQKQQARENIDAGSSFDISRIDSELVKLESTIAKQVLSVNGKHGHVILKNSDIENDTNYATINFVNSSIATNTATFRGTYNSLEDLKIYDGLKDYNDYAFVIEKDSAGNTVYNRYKYDGTAWLFEYSLNNSSFTQEQWAAVNSGITSSTTINNKLLNTNVILNAQDVGAVSIETGEIIIKNTATALETANTAFAKANEALQQSVSGLGSKIYYDDELISTVVFTSNPQEQINILNTNKADLTYVDEQINTLNANKANLNYVDEQIAALIGTAPETLNTLEEVAKAIEENETVVDALNAAIGTKANKSDIEPTIQFAESERQKSKNLFDINSDSNYKSSNQRRYAINGNTLSTDNDYTLLSPSGFKLDTRPNTDYTVSFNATYQNYCRVYVYGISNGAHTDIKIAGGLSQGFNSFKFNSGNYDFIVIGFSSALGETATFDSIQVEAGNKATEYQPYNGPILHEEAITDLKATRLLPSEYQEVEYIESTGTQYINTGYVTKYGDSVEVEFEYTTINNIYNFLYGATSPTNSDPVAKFGVRYYNDIYEPIMEIVAATYRGGSLYAFNKKVYKMMLASGNQKLYIDDVEVTVGTESAVLPNYNAFLFASNNGNNTYVDGNQSNGKLYKAAIKSGVTLVREFIPCYRKSDGEIGLYDTVNNVFYTNQGTGTFLKGENIYLSNVARRTDAEIQFAEEERQKTKNLFDKTAVLRDHELHGDSGANSANKQYYISDYIYVKGISNLYLSSIGKTSGKSNCFYDANRNHISTYSQLEGSIPVPANAVYMRFNGLLTELNNNVQLEVGNSASAYQSYNGGITHDISVDPLKRVPNTYQEVEYIESTGTQYIDTGVIGKTGVGAEISLMFTEVPSDGAILGARRDENHICPFHIYPSKWWYGYGGSNSKATEAASANIPYYAYSILKNGTQTLRVNDVPVALEGTSTTDINTNASMYIFAMNKNNTDVIYPSKFKLYMLRIYEGNTLVRDYVPCYRKEDGVAGLYDLVNDKFYTNAGTGNFLIGSSNISKVLSNENPEVFNSGLKIIKNGGVLDKTGSKDASIYCERRDTGVACHFGVGSGGTNHGVYSLPLKRWILLANKTQATLDVDIINLRTK